MYESIATRIARHEEEIRRLKLRADAGSRWAWHSLEPYLCGGWIDPYAASPFRYDNPTPDPSWTAGFYDTGQVLIFTGTLQWAPESWWASPPVDPARPTTGTPAVNLDALRFLDAGMDGLGNGVPFSGTTAAPEDQGTRLPYSLRADGAFLLAIPVVQAGSGRFYGWQAGTYQLIAADNGSGVSLSPDYPSVKVGDAAPVDTASVTHDGVPADFQISLTGVVLPYDAA